MTDSTVLMSWLLRYLPDHVTVPDSSAVDGGICLDPVSGDAGFRSYYRLNTKPGLIVVDAPPDTENNQNFVRMGLAFRRAGIHTPEIYAVNYKHGFLLLEDLGERVFLFELQDQTQAEVYQPGLATLVQIQGASLGEDMFPPYTAELFDREMQLFPHWFVEQLLGVALQADDKILLQTTFNALTASALEQPAVIVHRDFQIRNLLLCDDDTVGVVDYQDAVIGPVTYDLVSLLRDCYIHLSAQRIDDYLSEYITLTSANHPEKKGDVLGSLPDLSTFRRWFDLMGLQRHIKVLGIFARLHLRDNKPRYLKELPLFIRYVMEVAEFYPETRPFRQWFCERVLPALPQQDWYSPWETAGERE